MKWILGGTVLCAGLALLPQILAARGDDATNSGEGAAARSSDTRSYRIEGMSCAGCVDHIKQAINAIPGVTAVRVSYRERGATVIADAGVQNLDTQIARAVETLGLTATRTKANGDEH